MHRCQWRLLEIKWARTLIILQSVNFTVSKSVTVVEKRI